MGSKFLDYTGLSYYSSLLKNYFMKKGDTADAASKLETARTISLTGDATGSASFDGSEDASISTTLASSGVTAGSYGPSEDASPEHSGTFSVPYVTVDAKGRVTAASTKTITLPSDNNTDTKVTNTLATTTKAYVTGTTSSSTNTGTQVFDTGVYLSTTAGTLVATTFSGALSGNATTATTATKLGSSTVGSGTNPIYLSSGTATASSSTVGSGTTPVYLNAGTLTACSNAYSSGGWFILEVGSVVFMSYAASMASGTTITFPFTVKGAIRAFATRVSGDPDAYYGVTTTTTSATVYHNLSSAISTNLFVFGAKA